MSLTAVSLASKRLVEECGYSQMCLNRIRKDLKEFQNEPPPGIYVEHDDQNITQVHALIVGPKGTPYEKGLALTYHQGSSYFQQV